MTRRICCVCGIQYVTIDDGRDEVVDSHGYCERCHDAVMLQIKNEFAALPADGARSL